MNVRVALAFACLALAGCQTMAALGRVVEKAAYPTMGAAGGAALGGPVGAAGGAAAGHLIGDAVAHEDAPQTLSNGVERIFIQPTWGDVLWWPVFGVPLWLWAAFVGVILLRMPWIPAYLVDKFKSARNREVQHGEEDPQAHRDRR